MSNVSVHEIPGITLLYVPCVVTRDTMADEVPPLLDRVTADTRARGVLAMGNAMVVYRGAVEGSDDSVRLWVGVPVPGETRPFADYGVAALPNFRCATTIHVGPAEDVDEAYGELLQRIHEANLEPTAEIREEVLHHEPQHPDNDVTWLQVGVR